MLSVYVFLAVCCSAIIITSVLFPWVFSLFAYYFNDIWFLLYGFYAVIIGLDAFAIYYGNQGRIGRATIVRAESV
jgi:hypothetical protein